MEHQNKTGPRKSDMFKIISEQLKKSNEEEEVTNDTDKGARLEKSQLVEVQRTDVAEEKQKEQRAVDNNDTKSIQNSFIKQKQDVNKFKASTCVNGQINKNGSKYYGSP